MIKTFAIIALSLFCHSAFAAGEFRTTAEILASHTEPDTECSTRAFATALSESAENNPDTINQYTPESEIQNWIYDVFQSPEVITEVLSCPEIIDIDENDTIKFQPIKYTFPGGDREIVINYETQPHVLQQRLLLSSKTEKPTDAVSPELSATDPDATWVYTDPAWYGIMVTRAGALDEFVGPGKNNTVSFQYIKDNIGRLYPADSNGVCSTRSGMGAKINNSMVHKVMHEHTAKHEKDKNNYYIAGDIDLRWISYAEIALEVALAAFTWGASAYATMTLKGARATKIIANVSKNIKNLTKIDSVKDYVRASVKLAQTTRRVENIDKVKKSVKNINRLENALSRAGNERIAKNLELARKAHADDLAKMGKDGERLSNINVLDKLDDMRKASKEEIKGMEKTMKEMTKADKNVAEYAKQIDALKDVAKYAKDLRAYKKARTGNIVHRTWEGLKNARTSWKAMRSGTKTLNKAARVGRHGMKSGRLRDWLFHATRRNAARITRATGDLAVLSLVLGLIGDFYDRTEVETDEFTNGIKMEPLLLLSADNIEGQDNQVNYGMWLMWTGDSTSPEDDDAAYLQAMDFAQKFYQDLTG